MSSSSSSTTAKKQKRASQYRVVALKHESVLRCILQLVGPGQSLFTIHIARRWHLMSWQLFRRKCHKTRYAAALTSESRLLLACSCGFDKVLASPSKNFVVGRLIGVSADLNVLQLALSLGLRPCQSSLKGAICSGVLAKVQFL